MNKVELIGRLTADPESVNVGSENVCKCTMRIAVQRKYASTNGERVTDFFTVVVWRKLGELCRQYLRKGNKCSVVGELQTRSYTAQDGAKKYVTEIMAEEIEFLTPRAQENAEEVPPEAGEFTQVDDDELPF